MSMSTMQRGRWQNWSGSVHGTPRQIARPGSIGGLVRMIEEFGRDGRHVRVVGSGHSFTPLVQTDDVLMSLDNLQGIEKIDAEHGRVTVLGGTSECGGFTPLRRDGWRAEARMLSRNQRAANTEIPGPFRILGV